jgi:hypothetical protein
LSDLDISVVKTSPDQQLSIAATSTTNRATNSSTQTTRQTGIFRVSDSGADRTGDLLNITEQTTTKKPDGVYLTDGAFIAMIVTLCAIFVLFLVLVAVYLCRWRRSRKEEELYRRAVRRQTAPRRSSRRGRSSHVQSTRGSLDDRQIRRPDTEEDASSQSESSSSASSAADRRPTRRGSSSRGHFDSPAVEARMRRSSREETGSRRRSSVARGLDLLDVRGLEGSAARSRTPVVLTTANGGSHRRLRQSAEEPSQVGSE